MSNSSLHDDGRDDAPAAHSADYAKMATAVAVHRMPVLRLLLGITVMGCALFTAWNIGHAHYSLAAVELAFGAYILSLYLLTRRSIDSRLFGLAYVIPLGTVILLGFLLVPLDESFYVWMLTVPVAAYILLGEWPGFIITAGFLFLSTLTWLYKAHPSAAVIVSPTEINLLVSFVCVTGLAHIYERVRAESDRKLRASALRDGLTGIYNRTGVNLRFEHYLSDGADDGGSLVAILLDLDFFKHVNDTHGHRVGDDTLRRVARCLDRHTRSCDTVGRIGGEEFVVLMPNRDLSTGYKIAERIRTAIESSTVWYGSTQLAVTATLGVAERRQFESLDAFLERADTCLYRAKTGGRNQTAIQD